MINLRKFDYEKNLYHLTKDFGRTHWYSIRLKFIMELVTWLTECTFDLLLRH